MIKIVKNFNDAIELIYSTRKDIARNKEFFYSEIHENSKIKDILKTIEDKKEPGHISIIPVYAKKLDPFYRESAVRPRTSGRGYKA